MTRINGIKQLIRKATKLILYQNVQNSFSKRMAVLHFWSNAVWKTPEGQALLSYESFDLLCYCNFLLKILESLSAIIKSYDGIADTMNPYWFFPDKKFALKTFRADRYFLLETLETKVKLGLIFFSVCQNSSYRQIFMQSILTIFANFQDFFKKSLSIETYFWK